MQGPAHKKLFYNFVKHKKTEYIGISPLNSECQIHSDPVSKANILNKQFESVLSKPMPPITITVQGVDKLLTELYPNKAHGADGNSPRLLKELHTEITPILTIIFQSSLDTGIVPKDWKHAIITQAF